MWKTYGFPRKIHLQMVDLTHLWDSLPEDGPTVLGCPENRPYAEPQAEIRGRSNHLHPVGGWELPWDVFFFLGGYQWIKCVWLFWNVCLGLFSHCLGVFLVDFSTLVRLRRSGCSDLDRSSQECSEGMGCVSGVYPELWALFHWTVVPCCTPIHGTSTDLLWMDCRPWNMDEYG